MKKSSEVRLTTRGKVAVAGVGLAVLAGLGVAGEKAMDHGDSAVPLLNQPNVAEKIVTQDEMPQGMKLGRYVVEKGDVPLTIAHKLGAEHPQDIADEVIDQVADTQGYIHEGSVVLLNEQDFDPTQVVINHNLDHPEALDDIEPAQN